MLRMTIAPFVPKQWKDWPSVETPRTAAAYIDLEQRLADYAADIEAALEADTTGLLDREPLYVENFGGGVTKTATENTTAIQAAIVQLGIVGGGELHFRRGGYSHNGIVVDETRGIHFTGEGGLSGNAGEGTRLTYKLTGSGTGISARSTAGFHVEDIAILYDNAGMTGKLMDFSHSIASDTVYLTMERCLVGGKGVRGASLCMSLDKVIISKFTSCVFTDASRLVEGQAAAGSYSNSIIFDDCTFQRSVLQETRNAGEAWTFRSCTFEQRVLADGTSAAAGAYAFAAGVDAENLTFDTCWFGDADATGDWIAFSGRGLVVVGCHIGSGAFGIRLAGNIEGVHIAGNRFDNIATAGLAILGTGNKNFNIVGNHIFGSTPAVVQFGGTFPLNSRIQNANATETTYSNDTPIFTSAVTDASFPFTPTDSMVALENVAGVRKICYRIGGVWYKVVIA